MVISIVLLGVLFLAGLINLFFHFPTKKLYAWVDQYFFPKKNKISSTTTMMTTTSPAASGPNNKAEIKKVFATFDKNGDGFITKQELIESLKNIRFLITEKEVEEMVVKVDANGDGLIDLDEFCMLCKSSMVNGTEEDDKGGGGDGGTGEDEDLKEAFDVFDKDRDGLISVEELGFVLSSLGLKEGKKVEDCKEMIRKVDMDGDGMVNFDEFKRMMKTGGTLLLAAS